MDWRSGRVQVPGSIFRLGVMSFILGFEGRKKTHEGLDGGSWYSLITKNLAIYSLSLKYSLKLARLFIKKN